MSNGNDDDIEIIGGLDPRLMAAAKDDDSDDRSLTDLVEQPAKVMRIGTMIKQLLEEVRAAPLDDATRNRLREIHATSIRELEEGLAPELRDELDRLTLPFTEGTVPSDAELRIAFARLRGQGFGGAQILSADRGNVGGGHSRLPQRSTSAMRRL